ncbi:MAG: bifunctional DNA-formamidopyrimidine glycosylase/DNA-(apurinic or apyrimidinic site) lyase [Alphaproteobacteria bacterium]
MPELPEVETVRRGLTPAMQGRRIKALQVYRPNLRYPFPPKLSADLKGRRIDQIERVSKYLLFHFDKGPVLLGHMGMSGRFEITTKAAPLAPHSHLVFEMEGETEIRYVDPRRFGIMVYADRDAPMAHKLLSSIGPDPLSNAFNADVLNAALKGRKTPIKSALLDQKTVAGLGNIYVAEALHRAGISPKRSAHTVAGKRAERLVPHIRDVLNEAIASGGSSLNDYRQADGELGYFQHNFRVYDREGTPCPASPCQGTIRRIVQSGRSTFYCPSCQR